MYSLGNHLLVFILGYIFRIGYVVNQVGSNISKKYYNYGH